MKQFLRASKFLRAPLAGEAGNKAPDLPLAPASVTISACLCSSSGEETTPLFTKLRKHEHADLVESSRYTAGKRGTEEG